MLTEWAVYIWHLRGFFISLNYHMCFPVRSIKCLDYRFSVWLFLQLCGRAWCVFPGAGLGESSSMLRQRQVVFMGMSNRNMALELLSTLSLILVNWAAVAQVCERNARLLTTQDFVSELDGSILQRWPASLEKKENFLFPFVIWRWLKQELVHLKLSSC